MAQKVKKQPLASQKILVEVSARGTLTLPKAFRGSQLFEIRSTQTGSIELVPQHTVDAAQAWFWSERWQAMERAADADIAAGRVTQFDSAQALIEALSKL